MKSLTYYKYQKYNLLKSLNAKRKIFRSYKGKNTKSTSRTFRKTARRLALAQIILFYNIGILLKSIYNVIQ